MATSKSGNKSVKQAEAKRVFNVRRLRAMKDAIKQVAVLVDAKDTKAAENILDKATKRGILKKSTASRRKSKLARDIAGVK